MIRRMSVKNPLWGAPRIHGELLKLGFEVAQSSVAKYMVKRRGPPSQGWRTFLRNHASDIAAMDLFVVPTIGFDLLYAFVIVRLDYLDQRRRGKRAGSAYASDATGSNGPASVREECDGLLADAIDDATRHHPPQGTTTNEPLSDKLARFAGVLCPPTGVDPEIRATTPETGSNMPVIPPPGSPGGDPTIRPK